MWKARTIRHRRTASFLPPAKRRVFTLCAYTMCGSANALIVATYGIGMPMSSASPCITHPSMPPSSLRIRSNADVSWNSPLAGQAGAEQ